MAYPKALATWRGARRRVFCALAACLIPVALAACASGSGGSTAEGSTGSTGSGTSSGVFHLGVAYPETGTIAEFGAEYSNGIKLAIAQINKAGGLDVGGKKLQVVADYCDTQYISSIAVNCGRQLSSQDHDTVLLVDSDNDATPLEGFNASGPNQFLIIASAGSEKFTGQGDPLVARYYFDPKTYLPGFTKLVAQFEEQKHLSMQKLAILQPEDLYSQDYTEAMVPAWNASGDGDHVVGVADYQDGATDFSSQLTSLLAKGPDLIEAFQACAVDAQIVEQARQLGYTGKFLFEGVGSCGPQTLLQTTNVPASDVEGSIFTADLYNYGGAAITQFENDFQAMFHKAATVNNADGWSQAEWAFAAIEKAGSTSPTKVRAALGPALAAGSAWNFDGLSDLSASGDTTGAVHVEYLVSPTDIEEFPATQQ